MADTRPAPNHLFHLSQASHGLNSGLHAKRASALLAAVQNIHLHSKAWCICLTLVVASTSAPLATNSSTVAVCPCWHATSSGVQLAYTNEQGQGAQQQQYSLCQTQASPESRPLPLASVANREGVIIELHGKTTFVLLATHNHILYRCQACCQFASIAIPCLRKHNPAHHPQPLPANTRPWARCPVPTR